MIIKFEYIVGELNKKIEQKDKPPHIEQLNDKNCCGLNMVQMINFLEKHRTDKVKINKYLYFQGFYSFGDSVIELLYYTMDFEVGESGKTVNKINYNIGEGMIICQGLISNDKTVNVSYLLEYFRYVSDCGDIQDIVKSVSVREGLNYEFSIDNNINGLRN